jgi:hypothetical protein
MPSVECVLQPDNRIDKDKVSVCRRLSGELEIPG